MRAAGSAARSSVRAAGNCGVASRILRALFASLRVKGAGASAGALTASTALVAALLFATVIAGSASAAPKGVVSSFGGAGFAGGEFSSTAASPGGVAVNSVSGDVYVADTDSHRVQRFDADGAFVGAWGSDVISGGAAGTGSLAQGSSTVSALTATSKAFVVGQEITGAGIQSGTRITAVTTTPNSTLTLSKPATADGVGVVLSVAAGAGNVAVNERQRLVVTATAGTFKLTAPASQGFVAATTAANIPFDAPAVDVQTALETLPRLTGNVTVSGSPGAYTIDFAGALADTNVAQLTVAAGSPALSGGNATVTTTVEGGSGYEICAAAAQCKPGVAFPTVAPGGSLNQPKGVAVNQTTGDVYVANQALQRVEQFDTDGDFIRAWGYSVIASGPHNVATNERQTVTINGTPTSGTFTLSWNPGGGNQTTAPIAFNASPADVQTALEGLAGLNAGDVLVTSSNPGGGSGPGGPYTIEFAGARADTDVAQLTSSAAGLSPATTTIIATTQIGALAFEICAATDVCQKGIVGTGSPGGGFSSPIGLPAVAPVGAPNAGNVVVPDSAQSRVQEFTSTGVFVRAFGWDVIAGNAETGFEICRAANNDVCKAGVSGVGVGQFFGPGVDVRAVAVDGNGVIYTLEPLASVVPPNRRVQSFTPSGQALTPAVFNPQISMLPPFSLTGVSAADAPSAIAIGASNHLLVAKPCTASNCPDAVVSTERRVYEFASDGSLVETHAAGYAIPSAVGLASTASGDRLYASATAPTPRINVLGDPVPPTVVVEATTAVGQRTATLHGTVNPNGGDPGLQTKYRFEVSPNGTDWTRVPASDVDVGGGSGDVSVSQTATGLQPNRAYQVRLVVNKGGSPTTSTGDTGDFTTDPAAPDAETNPAIFDTQTDELILEAAVNPNNTATEYYFEYGTEPCSGGGCQVLPASKDASAGSGGQSVTVHQRVGGLEPDTTYHYRVVADNGVEVSPGETEVHGAERTITTPQAQGGCPNAVFRTGPSALLANCMAYERVTEGDSWGAGIAASVISIGDDGESAIFAAQAFDQPQSVPSSDTRFLAQRGEDGWGARGMLPEPRLGHGSSFGQVRMVSADQRTTLWPEATNNERLRREVQWTLVGVDGTRTPASPYLVPFDQHKIRGDFDQGTGDEHRLEGAAGDLSSFVFRFVSTAGKDRVRFFEDEPLYRALDVAATGIYQIVGADTSSPQLELVNRDTNPLPGVPGPPIGGVCGAGVGYEVQTITGSKYRAMSQDGSVVYFSADPAAPSTGTCPSVNTLAFRLYKRVNGTTTVPVSAARCSGVCTGSGNDEFVGASVDGSVVAFTTHRQLLDADDDSTSDLYVYDASQDPGEELIQASAGETVGGHTAGTGADLPFTQNGGLPVDRSFVDMSADGSRVYFTARGVLAGANAAGESPVQGQPNLYVFERDGDHPSGRIAFIATVAAEDAVRDNGLTTEAYALPIAGGGGDGRFLVFAAKAALVEDDLDQAKDMYRYDDVSGELLCVSCVGDGGANVGMLRRGNRSDADMAQRARAATGDASSIVFSTREALVNADENTANDVYLWDDGALSLVSIGTGAVGATSTDVRFSGDNDGDQSVADAGIASDGRSVFFITTEPLVASDGNNSFDMYVARVDGGFAQTEPEPVCDVLDDGCQGGGSGSISSDSKTAPSSGGENAESEARGRVAVSAPSARARRKASRTGRLVLLVRASSPGRVSVAVEAKVGKKVTRVGRASERVGEAGTVAIGVRLSSAARKRLRSGKGLRLTVEVRQAGARMRSISILLPGVKS
jgi:hypothetical protein